MKNKETLQAKIRNKLGPVNNLKALIEKYSETPDEKLLKYIIKESKNIDLDLILDLVDKTENVHNKKEFIVSAAIWCEELELKKEIPYCRSRNLEHGVVFAGLRHPHAMYTMVSVIGLRCVTNAEDGVGNHVQGFITSKDRFVDRQEAMKIALNAGQVKEGETYSKNELYSEDLY